jgi:hypothetical protein
MNKSELNVIDLCLDKVTKMWFLSIHVVWIIRIKIDFECIITKKGFKFDMLNVPKKKIDTLIFKIGCISILYNYLNILLHLVIYGFSKLLTINIFMDNLYFVN